MSKSERHSLPGFGRPTDSRSLFLTLGGVPVGRGLKPLGSRKGQETAGAKSKEKDSGGHVEKLDESRTAGPLTGRLASVYQHQGSPPENPLKWHHKLGRFSCPPDHDPGHPAPGFRPTRLRCSVAFLFFCLSLWTGLTVWAGLIAEQHVDYWGQESPTTRQPLMKIKLVGLARGGRKRSEDNFGPCVRPRIAR